MYHGSTCQFYIKENLQLVINTSQIKEEDPDLSMLKSGMLIYLKSRHSLLKATVHYAELTHQGSKVQTIGTEGRKKKKKKKGAI